MFNTILSKLLAGLGVVAAGGGVTVAVSLNSIHDSPGAKIETAQPAPITSSNTGKVQDSKPIDATKVSETPQLQPIADSNRTKALEKGDIERDDMPRLKPAEEGFKDRLRIVTYPKN